MTWLPIMGNNFNNYGFQSRLLARYSNLREIERACGPWLCYFPIWELQSTLPYMDTNNSTIARVNLFSWLQTNWTGNWFEFPTIHENLLMRYSTPGTFLFTGDWLDRYLIRWWYPPYQVTSHHPSPDPLSLMPPLQLHDSSPATHCLYLDSICHPITASILSESLKPSQL